MPYDKIVERLDHLIEKGEEVLKSKHDSHYDEVVESGIFSLWKAGQWG